MFGVSQGEAREVEVESFSAWDIATALRQRWFETPDVENIGGLLEWRGEIFCWTGLRWKQIGWDDLGLELWRSMQHCVQIEEDNQGVTRITKPTDRTLVANVTQALRAQIQLRVEHEPAWLRDGESKPKAQGCWAFEDVLVDVWATADNFKKTGRYDWVTLGRDASFFTTSVLPCKFDPNTQSPLWDRCMRQWGGDDELWREVRERFYGYAVWGEHIFDRWLMEFGQTRGGKGTAARLLARLLGHPAYFGTDMQSLGRQFGMEGLQRARVLVIEEAQDLDKGAGSTVARVLKSLTGGGWSKVERKGVDQQEFDLKMPSILQSNPPISLPDDKRGLSAKCVALRFDHSFVKNSDPRLDGKLWAERQGILMTWLRALVRLVADADDASKWFVMPQSSLDVLRDFELADNPWEAFLVDCCTEREGSKIAISRVRDRMRVWERETGHEFVTRRGKKVSDNFLVKMLIEHGSVPMKIVRLGKSGTGGRHVQGIMLSKRVAGETGETE